MAVRAGGKLNGVRYAGSSYYEPMITLPTIVSVSDPTPADSSALVLSGVNFSISGNAVYLTDGSTSIPQVIVDEAVDEITITVDRAGFAYGRPLALYVVNAVTEEGPNFPIALRPQTGWAFVELTVDDRIRAVGDLGPGDQLAYDTGGGFVHLRNDGSFWIGAGATIPLAFEIEAWSSGEGWGTVGTQTVQSPPP